MVLGAHVLVIKFIEFRSTFQHYIQFTTNNNLAIALLGTGQNCNRTKFKKTNFIKTKLHGGSILHEDTF